MWGRDNCHDWGRGGVEESKQLINLTGNPAINVVYVALIVNTDYTIMMVMTLVDIMVNFISYFQYSLHYIIMMSTSLSTIDYQDTPFQNNTTNRNPY